MIDPDLVRKKVAQLGRQIADVLQRVPPLERGLRELSEALDGTERTPAPRSRARATPKATKPVTHLDRADAVRRLRAHGVRKT